DVARNLRGADDAAVAVPQRRDGEGNIGKRAILALARGLEVFDLFPALDALEDGRLLVFALRRQEQVDRPADRLRGGVSIQAFRARVPGADDCAEVGAEDRVV